MSFLKVVASTTTGDFFFIKLNCGGMVHILICGTKLARGRRNFKATGIIVEGSYISAVCRSIKRSFLEKSRLDIRTKPFFAININNNIGIQSCALAAERTSIKAASIESQTLHFLTLRACGFKWRKEVVHLGTCEGRSLVLDFFIRHECVLLPVLGTDVARLVGIVITALPDKFRKDIRALFLVSLCLVGIKHGIELAAVERLFFILDFVPPLDTLTLAESTLMVATSIPMFSLGSRTHLTIILLGSKPLTKIITRHGLPIILDFFKGT
mmetsp:Transcript_19643/g.42673  ORF Transcript_19643/g.42673 Transcript_19643/m.42673 type:complete len:269 (-) Transcript_19643:1106-1912(-)